jgi:hypothetical protein
MSKIPVITRVTIEVSTNMISFHYGDKQGGMFWSEFLEKVAVPFDTENLFQVSYEPTRNFFAVEKVGGLAFNDPNSEELVWIRDNIEDIVRVVYEHEAKRNEEPAEIYRHHLLLSSDWPVLRHREQVDLALPRDLSDQEFLDLLNYRQTLRDMTGLKNSDGSHKLKSDVANWPTPPEWLPDWAK